MEDSAGRRVEVPARIERVFAAGAPATILVYAVAPDRLLGWVRPLRPRRGRGARPAGPHRPRPRPGATASLDFGNQVRVLTQVRTLARRGIAVILSTHDPDQAFLVADRAVLLHEGRLARLGTPDEVITPASLREAYGVEVEVTELTGGAGRRTRVCVPRLGEAGRAMA